MLLHSELNEQKYYHIQQIRQIYKTINMSIIRQTKIKLF